jgi:hypothetical protein
VKEVVKVADEKGFSREVGGCCNGEEWEKLVVANVRNGYFGLKCSCLNIEKLCMERVVIVIIVLKEWRPLREE